MKLMSYIKDKIVIVILFNLVCLLIFFILNTFHLANEGIIIVMVLLYSLGIFMTVYNYIRKEKFYNVLINNLKNLDKKFYILETIPSPITYEEKIFVDTLYDINKSMIENIKQVEIKNEEFKEFVELWIHEVKIPIASLVLQCHNNKNLEKKYLNEIKKLDNYVDQVLYYVRSEYTEKDFVIKETKLNNAIRNVSIKNKDSILDNDITLEVEKINDIVYTDSKWLEFIINQIINNSIKYKKKNNSIIKISTNKINGNVILNIYDNGIGIPSKDISRVFDKTFTGSNGREKEKSTGMGLYIVKKLCNKLGIIIKIESEVNEYTNVSLIFNNNEFYNIK